MTYVHEIKTDTTETNRQFKDNSLKFQQITFNDYRQLQNQGAQMINLIDLL